MQLLYFIVPAFLFFFVLLWAGINFGLHTFSGLRALARRFPMEEEIRAKGFRKTGPQSALIGGVSYAGTLRCGLVESFLVLKVMRLFSMGFSGAQIPLERITYEGERRIWRATYRCYRAEDTELCFFTRDDPLQEERVGPVVPGAQPEAVPSRKSPPTAS